MSIDMFERNFRRKLEKLAPFESNEVRDPRVWGEGFPAWRALFSSLCLYGHSSGYRIPAFDDFFRYCKKAYTNAHYSERSRYQKYFEGDLLPGMRQRVSVWYESGMAELHLYACLVEAIEDISKIGLVLYDPRADWKLKADVIVIIRKQAIRVSAFVGDLAERSNIEANRDKVEQERKKNTMQSAHWGNEELRLMPILEIARTSDIDTQVVNGVHLFSLLAVNRLLTDIYKQAGSEKGHLFQVQ